VVGASRLSRQASMTAGYESVELPAVTRRSSRLSAVLLFVLAAGALILEIATPGTEFDPVTSDSKIGTKSLLPASPEPSIDPGCPLGSTQSTAPISMSLLGCKLIASDTAATSSPLPFWGSIQCASASRYTYLESGGDTHLTATGKAQPDSAYRSLTVLDGDNFYGERCELGENNRTGPTSFYHEGQHRITYFSERLPSNFPLNTNNWQTVMQMKQTQPSHSVNPAVALEMEARQDHWVIANDWHTVWEFPASANQWTRFAWDVYYSKEPEKGWLQVSADLNGDGDFNDPGERSPLIRAATLQTEAAGSFNATDGIAAGEAIPSHLRMGIYHDPSIPCPAPSGCSIGVDNVQVLGPPS
jgi:hypothetical protein